MQQLTQLLKDGTMELSEVPFPALQQGTVLVRNHYSVISAGTEGKTVKDARLGYIGKAKARKEEVKKVIQTAKSLGLVKTLGSRTWSIPRNTQEYFHGSKGIFPLHENVLGAGSAPGH